MVVMPTDTGTDLKMAGSFYPDTVSHDYYGQLQQQHSQSLEVEVPGAQNEKSGPCFKTYLSVVFDPKSS
jgi:hypothetical protein